MVGPNQQDGSPLTNLLHRVSRTGKAPEQCEIIDALRLEVDRQLAVFERIRFDIPRDISYTEQAQMYDQHVYECLGNSLLSHQRINCILLHDMSSETLPNYRAMAEIMRPLIASIPVFEDHAPGYGVHDTRRSQAPKVLELLKDGFDYLSYHVERGEIGFTGRTTGLKFFLPGELIAGLDTLCRKLSALDGVRFPQIDEAQISTLMANGLSGGIQTEDVERNWREIDSSRDQIAAFKESYAPQLQELSELFASLRTHFEAAHQNGGITEDNLMMAKCRVARAALAALLLNSSEPPKRNPVTANMELSLAQTFSNSVNSLREEAAAMIADQASLKEEYGVSL